MSISVTKKFKKEKIKKLLLNKQDLINISHASNKLKTIKNCLAIASTCTYSAPAFDYKKIFDPFETNDIFKFTNNFFYGYCHEIAFFLKFLLKINKIKTRVLRLKSKLLPLNHWILEAKYNEKWIALDPTFGFFFKSKKTKKYLSSHEIKKIKTSEILINKKISLKKFKNLDSKNYFYYKNKKSFLNPKEKYFDFFSQNEIVSIKDGKYSYKKEILKRKKKDFFFFKKNLLNLKNYKIKKSVYSYGLKYGKLVKSDRFIKYHNFILKKNINSNKVSITNFPFPILDIKMKSNSNNLDLKIQIHKKNYYLKCNDNLWLLNKVNKKSIYKYPIRNINISNIENLKSLNLLFLKK